MKVAYSSRAVADIASIADYLSERSPQGALAVERRIREVLDRLAEFPGMGRELAQRPRVRVMPIGRYPYSTHSSQMNWLFYMCVMDRGSH